MNANETVEKTNKFEDDLREFVANKAKELGLEISFDSDRRNDAKFNIVVGNAAELIFKQYAMKLGYKASWFGKTFHMNDRHGRRLYKIVGCNKNSSRGYNVLRIRMVDTNGNFISNEEYVTRVPYDTKELDK